jgi:hypothetical protein
MSNLIENSGKSDKAFRIIHPASGGETIYLGAQNCTHTFAQAFKWNDISIVKWKMAPPLQLITPIPFLA